MLARRRTSLRNCWRAKSERASARASEFGFVNDLARLYLLAYSTALRDSKIVVVLKVKPKLCWQAEVLSEANGGVGADGAVASDDFVNAGKIERFRQGVGTHCH